MATDWLGQNKMTISWFETQYESTRFTCISFMFIRIIKNHLNIQLLDLCPELFQFVGSVCLILAELSLATVSCK